MKNLKIKWTPEEPAAVNLIVRAPAVHRDDDLSSDLAGSNHQRATKIIIISDTDDVSMAQLHV